MTYRNTNNVCAYRVIVEQSCPSLSSRVTLLYITRLSVVLTLLSRPFTVAKYSDWSELVTNMTTLDLLYYFRTIKNSL
jgi:hypothetical protein